MGLGSVIVMADALIFSVAIFNIIGLYFLVPIVRREFDDYWKRYKAGEFEADRTDKDKRRAKRLAASSSQSAVAEDSDG